MAKTVEEYLKEVDYADMAKNYKPSEFAIQYLNFIKMVNAGKEDIQLSPAMHYKMADSFVSKYHRIANLCFRGSGKALSLDTKILTPTGYITMGEVQVNDTILDRHGLPTKVTYISKIHKNPCYKFILEDGTEFVANEDHIHIVEKITATRKLGSFWKECEMTTLDLLKKGVTYNRTISDRNPTGKEFKWFIPLPEKLQLPAKNFKIDPYLLGAILGDGTIQKDAVTICGHKNDLPHILKHFNVTLNVPRYDKRNPNVMIVNLSKQAKIFKEVLGVVKHKDKYVPKEYLFGSIEQRLALLQGLMDTDGTIDKSGHCSFANSSEYLAKTVRDLVKSLGGYATLRYKPNKGNGVYEVQLHLWDLCPFRLPRKAQRWVFNKKYKRGKRIAIKDIIPLNEIIESKCIQVESESHSYLIDGYIPTHNTSVFAEFITLYLAVFTRLPNFGLCNVIMFVGDSMESGCKSFRQNVEARYEASKFLQEYVPEAKFTDTELWFKNKDGKETYVKMFGAKALSLDTVVYTPTGFTTIREINVGDHILGADGKITYVEAKSEIFNKPMYELVLRDGRTLKVCEDHLNQVHIKKFKYKSGSTYTLTEGTYSTKELLSMDLFHIDEKNHKRPLIWIENVKPLEFCTNENQLIDAYTVGLLIGDGSMHTKKTGMTPVVLTAHKDDWEIYEQYIPYRLGKPYIKKDNPNNISRTILDISDFVQMHELNTHGDFKKIPEEYLFADYWQRLWLLRGLMDTDGSAYKNGKCTFSSNSKILVEQVMWLVRSLGGYAYMSSTGKINHFKCVLELHERMFNLPRKIERQKQIKATMISIIAINKIADEPSQCIRVANKDGQFAAGTGIIRTHNSGIRGFKRNGGGR